MERRNQVEQGIPSLTERVQDLAHAGDGQLAEADDVVEFVVVDGDPNAPIFLWDDHERARTWRGRVLDQTCRELLVQSSVNFPGQNMVDPVGTGSDRRAIMWDRSLERHQGAGTKIRLGLGENVRKIPENIAWLFDC